MAETVWLNDGSMEVILMEKGAFLERLIRERLGDDAARCFSGYVAELKGEDENKVLREQAAEFERNADGYLALCREAMENFDAIIKLLEAPRLDRKALKKAAEIGSDALYNNL